MVCVFKSLLLTRDTKTSPQLTRCPAVFFTLSLSSIFPTTKILATWHKKSSREGPSNGCLTHFQVGHVGLASKANQVDRFEIRGTRFGSGKTGPGLVFGELGNGEKSANGFPLFSIKIGIYHCQGGWPKGKRLSLQRFRGGSGTAVPTSFSYVSRLMPGVKQATFQQLRTKGFAKNHV